MRKQVLLRVVTPVHVGCATEYDPTSFVMDETRREMILLDPVRFLAGLQSNDRSQLVSICGAGTIDCLYRLYKFMRGRVAEGVRIPVSQGVLSGYQRVLNKPQRDFRRDLNQLVVARTAFMPDTQRPYLPGSSVKGSLRTAYLNLLASDPGRRRQVEGEPARQAQGAGQKQPGRIVEQTLLRYRNPEEDPFRHVKVSDFLPVGDVPRRILYAVNFRKDDGRRSRVQQILEVIEPGAEFVGTIAVEQPPGRSAVNPGDLWKAIDAFYEPIWRSERALLSRMLGLGNTDPAAPELPLRVGFHSGAESVTIQGFRSIRVRKGKNHIANLANATTVWLALPALDSPGTEAKPFGWIEMVEGDAVLSAMEREAVWRRRWESELALCGEPARGQVGPPPESREPGEAAAERRRQVEAQAREEEERRRQEWETLPPLEKKLRILETGGLQEEPTASELVRELERLTDPDRRRVAETLRSYYQRIGKWSGQLSRKQEGKVAAIRAVLGE